MQGALVWKDDPEQRALIKRVILATLLGGLMHTLVCWFAAQLDFFRSGGLLNFYQLFGLIWSGHLLMVAFVLFGLNRALPDPSFTTPLMVWSTLALLASAWYVDHVRLSIMVVFFAVVQMGVFRSRLSELAMVSGLCVLGYLGILLVVSKWYPEAIDFTAEMIQWAAFSVMTAGMVIVAAEISSIRVQLAERNSELAGIVDRIQEMAIKDELTGLFNRRHAVERLHKLREMANRGAFDLMVAYADLDHFKQVNDTYGHHVGDEVLRGFAATARSLVSGRDFCARFGGEEFLLVLVKSTPEEAQQLCEDLRKAVSTLRFASEPKLKVTISMGLACYEQGEALDVLLGRADDALYQAKEGGRNRVCVAREGTA